MNDLILDLLKSTVPALVVFFTVYYLFKNYLQHQWQMASLENQKNRNNQTFPLKLQAYERLVLFCERITADQMIYRINHSGMDANELRNALLITIQQEYEHNLTQQIYVSEQLWQIIKLSKDQYQAIISETEGTTNATFIHQLYQKVGSLSPNPLDYARTAIRKETEMLLS
ncbi:MAG: hypothetical protein WAT79_08030 [Saprospiraceae bacterium]